MELSSRTIIGIGLLVMGIIFILHMLGLIEGFDANLDAAAATKMADTGYDIQGQQKICSSKTSCDTCLDAYGCGWCAGANKCVPKVNGYPIIPRDEAKGTGEFLFSCPVYTFVTTKDKCKFASKLAAGGYDLNNQATICATKASCGSCLDTASCGWCPGAKKCVPKINSYPVVPRGGAKGDGDQLFSCPVDTFVAEKDRCEDVVCDKLKTCGDCAQNIKCGWCGDAKKCFPKDSANNIIVPAGVTCAANTAVKNSEDCPTPPCKDIKNCVDCLQTAGCSFCEKANTCVRVEDKMGMVDGKQKVIEAKDKMPDDCNAENAFTAVSQCASIRGADGKSPDLLKRSGKPSAADIASAQDNSTWGWYGNMAKQTVASTDGPVSPAESSDVITSPGLVRSAGAGSGRLTFPAAAGLDDLEGPFEKYVQMLVRSELVAKGKIVGADGFAMKEEGAIENATGYVKKAWQGIFGAPVDLRIA